MDSAKARSFSRQFDARLARVGLSETLHTELADVYANLLSVATAIDYPLNELVFAQIQAARPLPFASVVLATGLAESDTATVRQQRIDLAAALELLSIALDIHALLLTSESTQQLHPSTMQNKNIIGGTILAGDYCFSRSAALAARTDRPAVVAIFAQALKSVSEALLRRAFTEDEEDPSGKATACLIRSGIEAAAILSALSEPATTHMRQFGDILAQNWRNGHLRKGTTAPHFDNIPDFQQTRWHEIVTWLHVESALPEEQ